MGQQLTNPYSEFVEIGGIKQQGSPSPVDVASGGFASGDSEVINMLNYQLKRSI